MGFLKMTNNDSFLSSGKEIQSLISLITRKQFSPQREGARATFPFESLTLFIRLLCLLTCFFLLSLLVSCKFDAAIKLFLVHLNLGSYWIEPIRNAHFTSNTTIITVIYALYIYTRHMLLHPQVDW